jgi:hypothetical protein
MRGPSRSIILSDGIVGPVEQPLLSVELILQHRAAERPLNFFDDHEAENSESAAGLPVQTVAKAAFYTGITRGKKLVVVVGQRKTLAIAVKNNKTEQRFSGLLARLLLPG